MGVTAFHIHWLSLGRDQIRSIHQIRGFMELKSASVAGRVTQECSSGGHLLRCAHTDTLTREPLTPIPSRLTLSLLYLLWGGSHEESCRPRVSQPVISLDRNDTIPLNCLCPITTSRAFKILTYGWQGNSNFHSFQWQLPWHRRCEVMQFSKNFTLRRPPTWLQPH